MRGLQALLAATLLAHAGCSGSPGNGRPEATPTPVAVASVVQDDIVITGTYPGELVADAAELAPRVSGRVVEVSVRIGDAVQEGQVLARLDDETLRHEAGEARALVEVAAAGLERARTEATLAARDLERMEPLAERELVSAQALDEARAAAEGAAADVVVAEARLVEARARSARLAQDVEDAALVAPWTGVVAERYLDPGALVAAGTPVLRVVEAGPLRVRFRIPEQDIPRIEEGSTLSVAAGGGEPVPGVVERIAGEVSRSDRSVAIEGRVDQTQALLPGMFATVTVALDVLDDTLVVPGAAVVERTDLGVAGETGVFVVAEDRARWTPIAVRGRQGDRVAVDAALSPDQPVLVLGHQGLEDGALVRVVEVAAP